MKKNKSRTIAVNAILIALLIVMSLTMLVTSGVAVLPLAVIVVGSVVMGGWTSLILGFTFGLVSFVAAILIPTFTAPFFQNPLVSIMPRMISAVVGFLVFKLSEVIIGKINNRKKKPIKEYTSKAISAALNTIFVVFFNTLIVLSMIWILFNGQTINGEYVGQEFIMGFIGINFAIEVCVTPLVAVPVAFAVDKFLKRNQKQVVTAEDIEAIDNDLEIINSNIETDNDLSLNESNKDIENNLLLSDNNQALLSDNTENSEKSNCD